MKIQLTVIVSRTKSVQFGTMIKMDKEMIGYLIKRYPNSFLVL